MKGKGERPGTSAKGVPAVPIGADEFWTASLGILAGLVKDRSSVADVHIKVSNPGHRRFHETRRIAAT